MNFTPPIPERKTDELVRIAHHPADWNPLAVEQAKEELVRRNISLEYQLTEVEKWNYLDAKKKETQSQRRAQEGYSLFDFLDSGFIFELLFDWSLKSEGYRRKHRQRKWILSALVILILLLYLWK